MLEAETLGFGPHLISTTAPAIGRFADTPDPRLKNIMTSLVQHLHDFVRDVELTYEEWTVAIDFLTRTGQICNDKRQEFILLSDTLGVSMLVDAINHRMPEGATQTTVLGPFYVNDPPEVAHGDDVSAGLPGEPLFVEGRVTSASGRSMTASVMLCSSKSRISICSCGSHNHRSGYCLIRPSKTQPVAPLYRLPTARILGTSLVYVATEPEAIRSLQFHISRWSAVLVAAAAPGVLSLRSSLRRSTTVANFAFAILRY
jgi:hypothetical protein